MSNKEIANIFNDLAKMMELYQENPFRIRSYQNAYIQLRKQGRPLLEMTEEEISAIKGVGKAISGKIKEIGETGTLAALEEYKSKTPLGVQDMLKLKGIGPKKIEQLWKDLEIESVGELWYACNENRLVELKGFGAKTQEDIKKKVAYFQQSQGKFHYATLEQKALDLLDFIKAEWDAGQIEIVGEMGRYCPIVSKIEILVALEQKPDLKESGDLIITNAEESLIQITYKKVPAIIYICLPTEFGSKKFKYCSSKNFINAFLEKSKIDDFRNIPDEKTLFDKAGIPFVFPELREKAEILELAINGKLPERLVASSDIKGVVHSHSTYSDGLHSLEEMAKYSKESGFEYLVISDHSKSAFYANGLKEDRVYAQMEEVDSLNKELAPFRIFKSIESDILNDGSLDYAADTLKKFDLIIASVHSNLKMDQDKATNRLIKAIENPFTTILGHPTGRLLLSREGYPIDHKKVIDACATNNVAIELNANPYRLDIDYTWIPYAMDKGVWISINPDAHSKEGIHHIHFGVLAARKGRLTADRCLNAKSLKEFEAHLNYKAEEH